MNGYLNNGLLRLINNKYIKVLVSVIMDKVLTFNCSPTSVDKTGDKPTFFVEFAGHIHTLCVKCYIGGYSSRNSNIIHILDLCHLSSNEYISESRIIENLEQAIYDIDKIIEEWESRQCK